MPKLRQAHQVAYEKWFCWFFTASKKAPKKQKQAQGGFITEVAMEIKAAHIDMEFFHVCLQQFHGIVAVHAEVKIQSMLRLDAFR